MVHYAAGQRRHLAYAAHAPVADIDVTDYAPLVKKLAGIMVARLPASVDVDDLIQVGVIGLIEAARQFDPAQGVAFETFASQRIRGAMLDELRREDWLPRQARRQLREIEAAIARLEQQLGRAPQEAEIADALGVALDDYQTMLGDCRGASLVRFGDLSGDDGEAADAVERVVDENARNPLETLAEQGFREELVAAIKALPERDQLVMALYYEQELNLKEIGAVLGVSESRVSQLHSQAIARLRAKLREWL
ncbi:RNA polymerase sigma-28 (SigD/FliA/WhiG) subunit [Crenobacter luteus]|uniref:RNA polymerase sigma factor FliA n=1 Tax=Crenobacter luteus TaxID=1452487 RepID=A0A165FAX5_9NEIS|nr:RNA polymerase sigma factor FliA [Crenobacter luteus]KZE32659.1 flagellar biosynthesis sigma factor [Crenobacter luteus]TCP10845.1 RNA polymerase sigma-28 (SigD/FliA/WhiG) subunit [Crenobacter luteus]